jgi:Holliday junction DNA helicase RuvA
LSKIKGVGKKTAERIILELKDKVETSEVIDGDVILAPVVNANEEAVMALMTLGYTRAEASDAVSRVQKDGMTLEQIIFSAIKYNA